MSTASGEQTFRQMMDTRTLGHATQPSPDVPLLTSLVVAVLNDAVKIIRARGFRAWVGSQPPPADHPHEARVLISVEAPRRGHPTPLQRVLCLHHGGEGHVTVPIDAMDNYPGAQFQRMSNDAIFGYLTEWLARMLPPYKPDFR